MTPEYISLVGVKEAAFRRQFPERRYFHSHKIDGRCQWCGRLPVDGDTRCPTLAAADHFAPIAPVPAPSASRCNAESKWEPGPSVFGGGCTCGDAGYCPRCGA